VFFLGFGRDQVYFFQVGIDDSDCNHVTLKMELIDNTLEHVRISRLPVSDHHGDVGNPVPVPGLRLELVLQGVLDG